MRKTFSILSLAALWTLSSASANAAAIVDKVGDKFTVNFTGTNDDITDPLDLIPQLSGTATFEVTSKAIRQLVLDVDLTNTTSGGFGSSIVALAFDVDPDALNTSTVSGAFDAVAVGVNFQAHHVQDNFDVCLKNGQDNNCNGGSQGGVAAGNTGSLTLTLNFGVDISEVSFHNFVIRYQSITYPQSYTGDRTSNSGAGRGCVVGMDDECEGQSSDVPEPTSMTLLGLGLLGASVVARRTR